MKRISFLGMILFLVFLSSEVLAITQTEYDTVVAQRDALYEQLLSLGVQPCIETGDMEAVAEIACSKENENAIDTDPEQNTDVSSEKTNCSIAILTDDLTVSVGRQLQIRAEIVRNTEDALTKSALNWSALTGDLIKVSANGMVTGIAPGNAEILCTVADNPEIKELVRVCVVQPVKSIKTQDVTLLYGSSLELARGKISVSVSPENATNRNCLYSSSDESVVIVDAEGNLQAKAPGRARITILPEDGSPGVRSTCNVTVGQAVTSISIGEAHKIEKKKSLSLKPEILPNNATQKKLEYVSSDPNVVTVSANGTITAVGCGTAIVTARATDGSGVSVESKVTVTQSVKSIKLNKSNVILEYGASDILIATVSPEDATDNSVIWESSDPQVVTVTRDGRIQGLSHGKATVTCYARDGSGTKATVAVQVLRYQSKTKNGIVSKGEPVGRQYNLSYTISNEMKEGKVDILGFWVQRLNNGFLRFRMDYQAPAGFAIMVFSPPDGEIFGFTVKKKTSSGTDYVVFEIHEDDMLKAETLTINFLNHKVGHFWVMLGDVLTQLR